MNTRWTKAHGARHQTNADISLCSQGTCIWTMLQCSVDVGPHMLRKTFRETLGGLHPVVRHPRGGAAEGCSQPGLRVKLCVQPFANGTLRFHHVCCQSLCGPAMTLRLRRWRPFAPYSCFHSPGVFQYTDTHVSSERDDVHFVVVRMYVLLFLAKFRLQRSGNIIFLPFVCILPRVFFRRLRARVPQNAQASRARSRRRSAATPFPLRSRLPAILAFQNHKGERASAKSATHPRNVSENFRGSTLVWTLVSISLGSFTRVSKVLPKSVQHFSFARII